MATDEDLRNMLTETLNKGISYDDYKTLVSELITKGKSTGLTQNESMLNYSKLSERRMKRWDKTFKMQEDDKSFFQNESKPLTFLIISEGWCGDAAHALPIINKITDSSPNIDLKIVLRDDNNELMDNFLTNGGKSIPKLIALDEKLNVLFTWGPRPKKATGIVNEYKAKHGVLTPEFKEDLQKWYNKDKGQNIVEDIKSELEAL
jgi:hypothetical protein